MNSNKKYSDYTTLDLLKDEFFIDWAKHQNSEAADFWNKWIIEHPEKVGMIEEAKTIANSFKYRNKASLANEDYIELYESILKKGGPVVKRSKFIIPSTIYRVAAVLALVAISYLFMILVEETPETLVEVNTIVKKTNQGEKLTTTLSDGTVVRLNAGSELIYLENFNEHIREVQLSGEAFFEVIKDKDRPFIVKTYGFTSEVLGTSFNINAYPDLPEHSMTLVTGKVKVVNNEHLEEVILVPGQQASLPSSGDNFDIREVDVSKILAWKDGILIFEKDHFEEVILQLERWYGVEVKIVGDRPELDRFSGRFENESLTSILNVLSYSSHFEYKINKKIVTIKF